jgi:hypothetical protein
VTSVSLIVVLLGAIIGGMLLITQKLDRIIRLLETANEELRYPNLEAQKRDLLGQDAYGEMNEML